MQGGISADGTFDDDCDVGHCKQLQNALLICPGQLAHRGIHPHNPIFLNLSTPQLSRPLLWAFAYLCSFISASVSRFTGVYNYRSCYPSLYL